jgi:hypothetical protein
MMYVVSNHKLALIDVKNFETRAGCENVFSSTTQSRRFALGTIDLCPSK